MLEAEEEWPASHQEHLVDLVEEVLLVLLVPQEPQIVVVVEEEVATLARHQAVE
jgi:hypothetical protein